MAKTVKKLTPAQQRKELVAKNEQLIKEQAEACLKEVQKILERYDMEIVPSLHIVIQGQPVSCVIKPKEGK